MSSKYSFSSDVLTHYSTLNVTRLWLLQSYWQMIDPNLFVDTSGDISMRSLGMGRSEVDESEVRPLSLGVKLAYNMAFLIQYARISSLKLLHNLFCRTSW